MRYTLIAAVLLSSMIAAGCNTPRVRTASPSEVGKASQEEVRDTMLRRVKDTHDTLLTDLGIDPESGSTSALNTAAADADAKKTGWTIGGIGAAGATTLVANGSRWWIAGVSFWTALATLLVSHYGDQETACVTAQQTVLLIQQFKIEWTASIIAAKDDDALEKLNVNLGADIKNLQDKVNASLAKCPIA